MLFKMPSYSIELFMRETFMLIRFPFSWHCKSIVFIMSFQQNGLLMIYIKKESPHH